MLAFSTLAQIERQRDPGATVKDQVDAYEETDHPKPGERPLRENEEAKQKCNAPSCACQLQPGKVATNDPIS